ncbi:MAG: response regulator transcription factor [Lachnospiraceae bacterium]|nr:response regulator transcription factor [Lachnospiraceae bacterium]
MKSAILIVEDDDLINNMIKEALELAGYSCLQAFSGTEGLLHVKNGGIDLVILDLMLPGMNGENVIKEIKNISDIPVIVVSAKDSIDSKIELLRLGADDYLTKPFDIKELEVRVEVRLRRHLENSRMNIDETKEDKTTVSDVETSFNRSEDDRNASHTIVFKELEMNPDHYSVKINGNPVDLTRHEFRILELLLKNPGKAFSKQAIYDYAWDDIYLGEDKTINVHISNIRKKLKNHTDTEFIDTVWGIGFKLAE